MDSKFSKVVGVVAGCTAIALHGCKGQKKYWEDPAGAPLQGEPPKYLIEAKAILNKAKNDFQAVKKNDTRENIAKYCTKVQKDYLSKWDAFAEKNFVDFLINLESYLRLVQDVDKAQEQCFQAQDHVFKAKPRIEESQILIPRGLDPVWRRENSITMQDNDQALQKGYLFHKENDITHEFLAQQLYDSDEGQAYHQNAMAQIQSVQNTEDKVLYMNFKSHNILDSQKAEKMFEMIRDVDADVVCLSEALVPNNIAKMDGTLYTLTESSADKIIQQPHTGPNIQPGFDAFKRQKNQEHLDGVEVSDFAWENKLIEYGYSCLIFANPNPCPWGSNWGNVMIMKTAPDEGDWEVVPLGTATGKSMSFTWKSEKGISKTEPAAPESTTTEHGTNGQTYQLTKRFDAGKQALKYSFTYDEARVAIIANGVVTTHLEDKDDEARLAQAQALAKHLKTMKKSGKTITLVGDMNSINEKSYSKNQRRILKETWFGRQGDYPHQEYDALRAILGDAVNTGQQFESKYGKCVSHAFSSGPKAFNRWVMPFTDVSGFDHQPLVLIRTPSWQNRRTFAWQKRLAKIDQEFEVGENANAIVGQTPAASTRSRWSFLCTK